MTTDTDHDPLAPIPGQASLFSRPTDPPTARAAGDAVEATEGDAWRTLAVKRGSLRHDVLRSYDRLTGNGLTDDEAAAATGHQPIESARRRVGDLVRFGLVDDTTMPSRPSSRELSRPKRVGVITTAGVDVLLTFRQNPKVDMVAVDLDGRIVHLIPGGGDDA